MAPTLRTTRFVCVSDTHNASPANGAFNLPKGDILVHCGDLTNQGTLSELQKAVDWIKHADFEVKIVIAGNHDITLDEDFYSNHGTRFHNQYPQDPAECIRLLQDTPSITYLRHESRVVRLTRDGGPQTTFKVFGSPYSPAHDLWAFSYLPEEASSLWDKIPLDTDVVLTHTPPKSHCDESRDRGAAGCEDLRQMLWRARPRLAICGHVHEGRGVQRVRWDLTAQNGKYKECRISHWKDPGANNRKQSRVDLSRKGGDPLKNCDNEEECRKNDSQPDDKGDPSNRTPVPGSSFRPMLEMVDSCTEGTSILNRAACHASASWLRGSFNKDPTEMRDDVASNETLGKYAPSSSTQGQGGMPPTAQCDLEALVGRMGRQETCVINAAIMATSWPHKSNGGKKYNKPIVVDIDLPLWEKESSDEGKTKIRC